MIRTPENSGLGSDPRGSKLIDHFVSSSLPQGRGRLKIGLVFIPQGTKIFDQLFTFVEDPSSCQSNIIRKMNDGNHYPQFRDHDSYDQRVILSSGNEPSL